MLVTSQKHSEPLPIEAWGEFKGAIARYNDKKERKHKFPLKVEVDGTKVKVTSENKVGHVSFESSFGPIRIQIEPKIAGSLESMMYAISDDFNMDSSNFERRTKSLDSPSLLISHMFLRKLSQHIHHIRRNPEEIDVEYRNKIRGQPLISQYLQRNVLLSPTTMPCRVMEWSLDNIPNRILRAALVACKKSFLDSQFEHDLDEVMYLMTKCENALAGVPYDPTINQNDIVLVRPLLRTTFRPYTNIMKWAELVLRMMDPLNFNNEDETEIDELPVGNLMNFDSTPSGLKWNVIDMPDLFEKYLRKILGQPIKTPYTYVNHYKLTPKSEPKWAEKNPANAAWRKKGWRKRMMKIDALFGNFILDAKYKIIIDDEDESNSRKRFKERNNSGLWHYMREGHDTLTMDEEGKFSSKKLAPDNNSSSAPDNKDIYQVLAYSRHRNLDAKAVGLVYPISSTDIPPAEEAIHYAGFVRDEGQKLPLYILHLPISQEGVREELFGSHPFRTLVEELLLSKP